MMTQSSPCRFLFLDPDADFLQDMATFASKRNIFFSGIEFHREQREELTRIVLETRPDIIIIHLDHDSEESFGSCVQEIHRIPMVPPPIVIGITNRTDSFLVQKVFASGVEDYLIRPVSPMALWLKLDVWSRIRNLQISFDLATRRLSTLNAKLLQSNVRLEELSITDELTGLNNMRFMTQTLQKHFTLLQRYPRPFSIIMLDLDKFKSVNDENDHLVGSATIKAIGEVIDSTTRNTDIKARYGGDEYIIAMPETDKAAAMLVAERIRKAIESNVLHIDEKLKILVTASIGVASYDSKRHRAFTDLVKDADRALYSAKESGRNKVCYFEGDEAEGYDANQSTIIAAVKKAQNG